MVSKRDNTTYCFCPGEHNDPGGMLIFNILKQSIHVHDNGDNRLLLNKERLWK